MNDAALARIMNSPQMPTLPAVAVQVLELTSRRDVQLAEIARVVEHDPAIATRVLKTVNSSFYGLTRRVGSIRQALAYLGMETVKGLVLGFSLARTFKGDDDVVFDFNDYWRRSILAASAARAIAGIVRKGDPDEAFVAALVRDIGMIALWRYFDDRYLQLLDLAEGDHSKLPALERRHFEVDHAEIGAAMVEGWKFPSEIVDVVLLHHHGTEVAAQDEDMRRVVLLAGEVAESLAGDPRRAQAALRRYEDRAAEWFDLRRGTAMAALKSITEHANELGRLFELDTGKSPDVDALLEEADRLRRSVRVAMPDGEEATDRDPVTGLPDRSVFQQELLSSFETGGALAVLLVGVDGMRELNREGGPGSGDAALARASEAVVRATREACGEQAQVHRFVGAELAVFVRGDAVARAESLAERLRAAVRLSPFTDESLGLRSLGVSVGVATRTDTTGPASPDELLRAAMMALSEARRTGGDAIVAWQDGEPVSIAA
jgi:two-component system cell cycle response regulator